MPVARYTPQETVRLGKQWYEKAIRAEVEREENIGKVVVVNIETGDYEIDADHLTAAHRALDKDPEAQLFALRVGFPALAKMGGSWGVRVADK